MPKKKNIDEMSQLILVKTGFEKSQKLSLILDAFIKENPEEQFIIIDTKRVEFVNLEKKVSLLGPRIKEVNKVAPLLQKLLDENENRLMTHRDTPKICLLIGEYGDIHQVRPECDDIIAKLFHEAYAGIYLIIATQRATELEGFINKLRKDTTNYE